MYSPQEETEIFRGIGDVIFNLQNLPIDDVAYFLVEREPKLAERLAALIEINIFDKEITKNER